MIISRKAGQHAARWLLIGAVGTGLAACGGGGSGDAGGDFEPFEGDEGFDPVIFNPDDRDGDGIPNGEDPDFDANDLDGDGTQNSRDDDIDGDGTPNDQDDDIDGDGTLNASDTDADGDGFRDPTEDDVCGGSNGEDADSSSFAWNDNCTVQRRGQFADSLYAAGVQRVVYCAGFGEASSVDAFTDGEFGSGTEDAVTAFQEGYNAENPDGVIGVDGEVGPQTWAALQSVLERVENATFEGDEPFYDGYGVPGERCGDTVLFLNEVEPGDDGLSIDRQGWRMTRGATDTTPVPFSIEQPFGIID